MSYYQLYVHLVWSTYLRNPYLKTKEIREQLWHHIKLNASEKGIYALAIGGYKDHCHCLVSLSNDQSIQNIVQLIKGESSYWINKKGLIKPKFRWQKQYWAVSISKSELPRVLGYIGRQEEHHSKIPFQEELSQFLKVYDLSDHVSKKL